MDPQEEEEYWAREDAEAARRRERRGRGLNPFGFDPVPPFATRPDISEEEAVNRPRPALGVFGGIDEGLRRAVIEGGQEMQDAWTRGVKTAREAIDAIKQSKDVTGVEQTIATGKGALGVIEAAGSPVSGLLRTGIKAIPRIGEDIHGYNISDAEEEKLNTAGGFLEILAPGMPLKKVYNALTKVRKPATSFAGLEVLHDMTLKEAIGRGWARKTKDGGYELTEAGEKIRDFTKTRIEIPEKAGSLEERTIQAQKERGLYIDPKPTVLRQAGPETTPTTVEQVLSHPKQSSEVRKPITRATENIPGSTGGSKQRQTGRMAPGSGAPVEPRPPGVGAGPVTTEQVRPSPTVWMGRGGKEVSADPETFGQAASPLQRVKKPGLIKQGKALFQVNSPTEIAKGIPPMERAVELTNAARRKMNEFADTWFSGAEDIRKAVGNEAEFKRVMRARDHNQPLNTTPEVEAMVNKLYDDMSTALGEFGQPGMFKQGFIRRLRQNVKVDNGELLEGTQYTAADLRNIAPGTKGDQYIKQRLGKEISDDEAYSFEGVSRYVRSAARSAVLGGTATNPGYLGDIKPILKEVNETLPDVFRKYTQGYVNYFIGVPESRSAAWAQQLSERARKYQFVRTLGLNPGAAISNLGQGILTFTETSALAMVKAVRDTAKWRAGDKGIDDLLERAGLKHELRQTGVLSDYAPQPTELMGKADRALEHTTRITGIPFREAERFNRTTGFLAGYHDAIAKGMSDEDAIKHGKDVMFKTQFTGGETDMPSWFRGALGGAFGQYKTFPIKYAEYMYNNAADFAKALANVRQDPQAAKDAGKKVAKFWASNIALGGTGALTIPGYGDWFENYVGRLPSDVQKGLGGLMGVELAHMVGTGVLPIEEMRDMKFWLKSPTVNSIEDALKISLYATGGTSTARNAALKLYGREISDDDFARAVTRAFPAGTEANRVRDIVKDMRTGGQTYSARDLWEAFGVTPATGNIQSEVPRSSVATALGFRQIARERESDLREREGLRDTIANNAKKSAAEAVIRGESGEPYLAKGDADLKAEGFEMPPLKITESLLEDARSRRHETVLERRRRTMGDRGILMPPTE